MNRVEVKPDLLRWARERAGLSTGALARRFLKLEAWECGALHPTLKQLEGFARATHTPVDFLFLDSPPAEHVPIPDFRTVAQARIGHPSPDLLGTIYLCQQRQDWYREFARSTGERPLDFVGSVRLGDDVVATADRGPRQQALRPGARGQHPGGANLVHRVLPAPGRQEHGHLPQTGAQPGQGRRARRAFDPLDPKVIAFRPNPMPPADLNLDSSFTPADLSA